MSRVQRSAKNAVFNVLGWIMPMAINIAATPILVRGLGADGYGLQNLVVLVTSYFAILDMGLDIAGVKYLAEYHARREQAQEARLVNTALGLYTLVGLCGAILLVLSAEPLVRRVFDVPAGLQAEGVTVFQVGALGFVANMLLAWGCTVFYGLQRYEIANAISMGNSSLGVGAGMLAVFVGYGVTGYVLVKVLVSCLAALIAIAFARHLLPTVRFAFTIHRDMLHRIGAVMGYGLVLRLTGVLTANVDKTLIGVLMGTAALTYYAVPNMVSTALGQIPGRILHFLFPMASELSSSGQQELLQDVYIRATRFLAGICAAIFFPLMANADLVLAFWMGTDFAGEASVPFLTLLAASYISSACAVPGIMVSGMGRFRAFTSYAVGKALAIAAACGIGTAVWGIEGTASGLLFGSAVDVGFMAFSSRRHFHLSLHEIFRRAYGPAIACGALVTCVTALARPIASTWVGLLCLIVGSAVIILALGFAFGVFGDTEKRAVRGLGDSIAKLVQGLSI